MVNRGRKSRRRKVARRRKARDGLGGLVPGGLFHKPRSPEPRSPEPTTPTVYITGRHGNRIEVHVVDVQRPYGSTQIYRAIDPPHDEYTLITNTYLTPPPPSRPPSRILRLRRGKNLGRGQMTRKRKSRKARR